MASGERQRITNQPEQRVYPFSQLLLRPEGRQFIAKELWLAHGGGAGRFESLGVDPVPPMNENEANRMLNTFSIDMQADDEDDRLWIVIDGERRFQLGSENLVDTIFSPDGASEWLLLRHRDSECERVVSYGFCVEDCCPSKLATVRVTDQTVSWTNIRESTSSEILNAEGFEFDRKRYDSEISRVLIALVEHYRQLCRQLRWAPATQPLLEQSNDKSRNA